MNNNFLKTITGYIKQYCVAILQMQNCGITMLLCLRNRKLEIPNPEKMLASCHRQKSTYCEFL